MTLPERWQKGIDENEQYLIEWSYVFKQKFGIFLI